MVLRIRDDMACNSVITVGLNALTVPRVAQFPSDGALCACSCFGEDHLITMKEEMKKKIHIVSEKSWC